MYCLAPWYRSAKHDRQACVISHAEEQQLREERQIQVPWKGLKIALKFSILYKKKIHHYNLGFFSPQKKVESKKGAQENGGCHS